MKIKSLTKSISIIFMLATMLFGCCLFGNEDTGGNGNSGGGNNQGGGNNEGGNGGGGGGGEIEDDFITITFDTTGIGETAPAAIEVLPGASVDLPTFENNDKFLYWSTSADGMDTRYLETATFNESVTLYAIGLPDGAYRIIYELDGGKNNINNPFYLEMGQTAELGFEPTKDRYSFAGWYTDEACTEENKVTQITQTTEENIVLYAKWVANKAAITITQNEPEVNLQQVTDETTVTFTADAGFEKYTWNIDGKIEQSGTSSTFTIYTSSLNAGIIYKIAVIMLKEGQYYSASADLQM